VTEFPAPGFADEPVEVVRLSANERAFGSLRTSGAASATSPSALDSEPAP
jgi:hypothetical protein